MLDELSGYRGAGEAIRVVSIAMNRGFNVLRTHLRGCVGVGNIASEGRGGAGQSLGCCLPSGDKAQVFLRLLERSREDGSADPARALPGGSCGNT